MYFPYLYGRDAELDALAARSADFGTPQQIVPVIEPALKPGGQLPRYVGKICRTLNKHRDHGASAYVVVNPRLGAFEDSWVVTRWSADVAGSLGDPTVSRPAFKVRSDTGLSDLRGFVSGFAGRDIGVIVDDERAIDPRALAREIAGTSHRVFLMPGVDSGAFSGALGSGQVVRVLDNFNSRPRNADYSGREVLADNHRTYGPAGLAGFADFTVLPSDLNFGGGRTGAAVVHLTYEGTGGDLWVEHFVSDERDVNSGTFQSKLLEALNHMAAEIARDPGKFQVTPAVKAYQEQLSSGRATSQGKNKQLQIEHHLFVVARLLGL